MESNVKRILKMRCCAQVIFDMMPPQLQGKFLPVNMNATKVVNINIINAKNNKPQIRSEGNTNSSAIIISATGTQ